MHFLSERTENNIFLRTYPRLVDKTPSAKGECQQAPI